MPARPQLVRALAVGAAAATLSLAGLGGLTGTASADTATGVKSIAGGGLYNAGHLVFTVKDLGGGAYWNVTTGGLFIVDNAADTFGGTLASGELLAATAVDDGRGALRLVDGTVIVPAQQALGL